MSRICDCTCLESFGWRYGKMAGSCEENKGNL